MRVRRRSPAERLFDIAQAMDGVASAAPRVWRKVRLCMDRAPSKSGRCSKLRAGSGVAGGWRAGALAEARPPSDLARRPLTHRMTRMASSSRRDFVRMSALAAAGVPLIRPLGSIPSIAHRATPTTSRQERKLGFALVGLGSLSTNQIAPALQKTKTAASPAIVTGTPAKAAKWKAQYGIPDKSIYNYETMGRMADNPDIDVVYVVTPNSLHARTRSRRRRPGSTCSARSRWRCRRRECQEMIAAVKQANRQLAIGYRCRFEPHHLEMRAPREGEGARRRPPDRVELRLLDRRPDAVAPQLRARGRRAADGRRHLLAPVGAR